MNCTAIDSLPEELLLHIFELLDSPPPSIVKARWEPSLELTSSLEHVLKDISRVSKRWRRIVLPLLFKNARLCLDGCINATPIEWVSCSICRDYLPARIRSCRETLSDQEPYHAEMMEAVKKRLREHGTDEASWRSLVDADTNEGDDLESEMKTLAWASRFYHLVEDFLFFIKDTNLATHIQSFVLLSDEMLVRHLGRYPHFPSQLSRQEWRYPAVAALWQQLFSVVNPLRVVIIATPTDLACLTNAAIETQGVSHIIDWSLWSENSR